MSSPSQLDELLALLTNSINVLKDACSSGNTPIPNIHEPFSPPSEAFRQNPVAAGAAAIISAAALQIDAIVTPPQVSLYRAVGGVCHALDNLLPLIRIQFVVSAFQIRSNTRMY